MENKTRLQEKKNAKLAKVGIIIIFAGLAICFGMMIVSFFIK